MWVYGAEVACMHAAVKPIGVADTAPAALSIEALEADIAADEAITSTEKATAQRKSDVASRK